MIFFFDENISKYIARMLDIFELNDEHTVQHIVDRFGKGAKDEDWLTKLGQEDDSFVVLSKDAIILKNEFEKRALRKAALTFVLLDKSWKNIVYQEQAWRLVKAWPEIVEKTTRVKKPTIFRLGINGKVIK